MDALREARQKVRKAVEENGFFVTGVPGEGDASFSFAYTAGLFSSFQHPEIVMIGDLPVYTLLDVVEQLATSVKAGGTYEAGKVYGEIVPGFRHVFVAVDRVRYPDIMGSAIQLYQSYDFPTLQCVWPDEQDVLPWEDPENAKEWTEMQPLLGSPGELTIAPIQSPFSAPSIVRREVDGELSSEVPEVKESGPLASEGPLSPPVSAMATEESRTSGSQIAGDGASPQNEAVQEDLAQAPRVDEEDTSYELPRLRWILERLHAGDNLIVRGGFVLEPSEEAGQESAVKYGWGVTLLPSGMGSIRPYSNPHDMPLIEALPHIDSATFTFSLPRSLVDRLDETQGREAIIEMQEAGGEHAFVALQQVGTLWRPGYIENGSALANAALQAPQGLSFASQDESTDCMMVLARAIENPELVDALLDEPPDSWEAFRERIVGAQPRYQGVFSKGDSVEDTAAEVTAKPPAPAAAAFHVEMNAPAAVAINPDSSVWILDGTQMLRLTPKGEVQGSWHADGTPSAFALGPGGTLYVADRTGHCIRIYSPSGEPGPTLAAEGGGFGQLLAPSDVAIAEDGSVLVADAGNNRVQRFSPEGRPVAQWRVRRGKPSAANAPLHVAVDVEGNVWVADEGDHRLQKLSPTGKVLLSRGGHPGDTPGKFRTPTGVAADAAGNIYVLESGNNRVQRLSPDGIPLVQIGGSGTAPGLFNAPHGLALDADCNIVVADTENQRVQKLSPSGVPITEWARNPQAFGEPNGLAVDMTGALYWTDTESSRVYKVARDGRIEAQWGAPGHEAGQFHEPRSMATQGNEHVLVVDAGTGNGRVQRFSANGTYHSSLNPSGESNYEHQLPLSVAVDSGGNVHILFSFGDDPRDQSYEVRTYTAAGALVRRWGKQGDQPGELRASEGIAVDADDNLYVVDNKRCCIMKFSARGAFLSEWGSHGSGPGQFAGPARMSVDRSGNMYVADAENERICKLSPDGDFLTQFGSRGTGPGQFQGPIDIGVDSAGTVFVLDSFNDRVQHLSPEGTPLGGWSLEPMKRDLRSLRTLSIDSEGNVIVTDPCEGTIRRYTPEGRVLDVWSSPVGALDLSAVADAEGNIYAGQVGNGLAFKMSPKGKTLVMYGARPDFSDAELAIGANGTIWVAAPQENRVLHLNYQGKLLQEIGAVGQFGSVTTVACDSKGFAYVSDVGKHCVWKISPDGDILFRLGNENGLEIPACLAVDETDTLYVVDARTNEIRTFASQGGDQIRTLDLGGALQHVDGLAVGPGGTLYLLERTRSRIRVVSPSGELLREWGSGHASANRRRSLRRSRLRAIAERYARA